MLPGRPSTAYSLSKGAIDAFTKSLAYEAGPRGVRVNAIAPGTVNTALVQAVIARLTEEGKAKFSEMVKTIYPLGRIGEPDDVSGAAVFLASDEARWITGTILAVDGGLTTNL
jgi:NAD(P)-dependent dehydrogenase (short-subunit alcohol dehydrogenase family)